MFKVTALLACLFVLQGIMQTSASQALCLQRVEELNQVSERAMAGRATLQEICDSMQVMFDACRAYVDDWTLDRLIRKANRACGGTIQGGEEEKDPKKLAQHVKNTPIKFKNSE